MKPTLIQYSKYFLIFIGLQFIPVLLLSNFRNVNFYQIYLGSPFIFYLKDMSGEIGNNYEKFIASNILFNIIYLIFSIYITSIITHKYFKITLMVFLLLLSIFSSFLTQSFFYV
jgi:hypothetical protein